jgi:hypothetical protein
MDDILLICIPKKLGCTSEVLPLQVSKMLINASITFIFLDLNGFSTTRASAVLAQQLADQFHRALPKIGERGAYVNGQTIVPLPYKMVTVSVSVASRTPRVATGVG